MGRIIACSAENSSPLESSYLRKMCVIIRMNLHTYLLSWTEGHFNKIYIHSFRQQGVAYVVRGGHGQYATGYPQEILIPM